MAAVDPAAARAAVVALVDWIRAGPVESSSTRVAHPAQVAGPAVPSRPALAAAVRLSAQLLAERAKGGSVEVRVPPFVAIQCIEGPRHTRGTPPNVVELTPHNWLRWVCGIAEFDEISADPATMISGSRAPEVGDWMPLLPL